jgi:hypothetical protein
MEPLGGRRGRPMPPGAVPMRMGGVGDFPVESKGEGSDLFAFNQTIEIVCSALEQFGFSLGSLLQDRKHAQAPPAWATSPLRGLAARTRSVAVGRLGWAARSVGVSIFVRGVNLAYYFM